jgi:hypothetical protein
MIEGPLSFEVKGIRIVIPRGGVWDKAGFSFPGKDGQESFIPILHREVIFHIHRELFNQKEWIINYEDPLERAAQEPS